MVFNGEIYNSVELRARCEAAGHRFRSTMDGEVILHLWEMYGDAALQQLNGIFVFAIANKTTGEVVLARDPLGVKPLFYVIDDCNALWFASDLTTLAAIGARLGGQDVVGLAQFLTFLWIPDPRTPYSDARSLSPGNALLWNASGSTVSAYAEPLIPPAEPDDLHDDRAITNLSERFCAAVDRQLLSDVPIGLMASGGLDSGLLWWAARGAVERAYTITWPATAGGERLDEDAAGVNELERQFGTSAARLSGENLDLAALPLSGDLFADPAYELSRAIAKTARGDGLKVLLSGQGGDELFGGYRRHRVARVVEHVKLGRLGEAAARNMILTRFGTVTAEYLSRLARATARRDPLASYMELCTYSSASDRARLLDCSETEVADDIVWQRHREVYESLPGNLSFLRKVMTVDLQVYLPGLGLAYVDRAGMEFGVEIRVPWLDLELVRWSLRLPERLLIRGRQGKWLCRQLAARSISPEMAARAKRGFGAPASYIRPTSTWGGALGFRQARYLDLAVSMLKGYTWASRHGHGAQG